MFSCIDVLSWINNFMILIGRSFWSALLPSTAEYLCFLCVNYRVFTFFPAPFNLMVSTMLFCLLRCTCYFLTQIKSVASCSVSIFVLFLCFIYCIWLTFAALIPRVQDGCTALMHAAAKGHTECVRLLLDDGADKNAQSNVRDLSHRFLCFWWYFVVLTQSNHFSSALRA